MICYRTHLPRPPGPLAGPMLSLSLQPGYTVVELQCLASTQALPFAPLITFLRSQQTMQRITALLPRPPLWVSDVAGLVPDLQAIIPNAGIPTALSSRDELLRMFEAIAQSVLAFSSRPLFCGSMTSIGQTRQRSIGSTISSSVKAISHCSWLPLIVQRMLPHRSFNSRHNGLVLVFCSISRSAL